MSDTPDSDRTTESPFDQLIAASGQDASFSTAFRGYDRDEVDTAIRALTQRADAAAAKIAELEKYQRKASAAVKQAQQKAEELEAQLTATADEDAQETITRLEGELLASSAKLDAANKQNRTLTDELKAVGGEAGERPRFEEILRVAEEQAGVIISNASIHAERLLEGARDAAEKNRHEVQAEADAVLAQAHHEAQQARLRIDTELTAHEARIEREAAHAAEKVAQAEQEAAAIRTEAEKGAAALRSLVTRETGQQRADAEAAMRELQLRTADFEASLTRRQDEAQQEFLLLHNQAVAHAERITNDANAQVAASLDHAKRVSTKADDFERLMRAQAQQIEADATLRARERLDDAQAKAKHILDLVTAHAQSALRDADDRARQLRWQQHELTGFLAEVGDLIRLATSSGSTADSDASTIIDDLDAELEELTESDAEEQPAED